MELEADNRGITEILEKQSLEMDAKNVSHLKENRLPKKLVRKIRKISFKFWCLLNKCILQFQENVKLF